MQAIKSLTEKLYADIPKGLLYHYTTLKGLLGIVNSSSLWASDITYMNDSAELKHSADLISLEVQDRIAKGRGKADLLGRFVDWVLHRITNGHLLFAASFRSHGNLLSQWRGYSSHGKGVSLGFSADYIVSCAHSQNFRVCKCIYDPAMQRDLIRQIVDVVESQVEKQLSGHGTSFDRSSIYQTVFAQIETDLLRIAAVLKHPSFQEEEEWRVVSPVITDNDKSHILFREANAMLVPYVEYNLKPDPKKKLRLDHLFLGPTSNINISMNSLKMFLAKNGIEPEKGIAYCQIPYRQR